MNRLAEICEELDQAWRRLDTTWQELRSGWKDQDADAFEQEVWESARERTKSAVKAIQTLAQVAAETTRFTD